jgi:hypothetical protein
MTTQQLIWAEGKWSTVNDKPASVSPQLCLLFGSRLALEKEYDKMYSDLKAKFPEALIVASSTAGNIVGIEINNDDVIATCLSFNATTVTTKSFAITDDNKALGVEIGNHFSQLPNLANLMFFSTMKINGANLTEGINSVVKGIVPVVGGIAGDSDRFSKTLTACENQLSDHQIVVVSLQSERLHVNIGTNGGWETFGPKRTITKSIGNELIEVDNQSILQLYKDYLGDKASELPGSALLFPFAYFENGEGDGVVRGVSNVTDHSILLYADVKEGDTIQFMRSNYYKLIDGAGVSAQQSVQNNSNPEFSLLVSCAGRKLALKQFVEEELIETQKILGENTILAGFYAYTEFAPTPSDKTCQLHNQTMTITSFTEY